MTLLNEMTWPELTDRMIEQVGAQTDKKYKEWLLSKEKLNHRYYDARLYRLAYMIHQKLKTDRDHVTVIVGKEGTGKSTLGINLAGMVSDNFAIKNICYEPEDFIKELRSDIPKGSTLLMDEGALFLFSRDAMGNDSRTIVRLLTIIRQMNLHIIICVPSFWIIDSYVREHRVDTLLEVTDRGKYTGIIGDGVKMICTVGRQSKNVQYSLRKVPHQFWWRGDYVKDIISVNDVNMETYSDLKVKARNKHLDKIDKEYKNGEDSFDYIKVSDFAKKTKKGHSYTIKMIKKGVYDGKMLGHMWYIHKKYLQ